MKIKGRNERVFEIVNEEGKTELSEPIIMIGNIEDVKRMFLPQGSIKKEEMPGYDPMKDPNKIITPEEYEAMEKHKKAKGKKMKGEKVIDADKS